MLYRILNNRALAAVLGLCLMASCTRNSDQPVSTHNPGEIALSDSLLLEALFPGMDIVTLDKLPPYVKYNEVTDSIEHDSISIPFHAVIIDSDTRARFQMAPSATSIQVSNRFELEDNHYLYLLHEDEGYGSHAVSKTIMVKFEMTRDGVNILQLEDAFPIGGAEWSRFTRDVEMEKLDENHWMLTGWHSWGGQRSKGVFRVSKVIPKHREDLVLNPKEVDGRDTLVYRVYESGLE